MSNATTYDLGYQDGFTAGVEHYKKFTKSPEFTRSSQPQAAADVVLVSRKDVTDVLKMFAPPITEYSDVVEVYLVRSIKAMIAEIERLPPHGKE